MALSATEKIQFYQIVGLPATGSGLVLTSLVHVPFSNTQSWEPTWNVGDFSDLITAVDAKLAAATALDAMAASQSLIAKIFKTGTWSVDRSKISAALQAVAKSLRDAIDSEPSVGVIEMAITEFQQEEIMNRDNDNIQW